MICILNFFVYILDHSAGIEFKLTCEIFCMHSREILLYQKWQTLFIKIYFLITLCDAILDFPMIKIRQLNCFDEIIGSLIKKCSRFFPVATHKIIKIKRNINFKKSTYKNSFSLKLSKLELNFHIFYISMREIYLYRIIFSLKFL